MPALIIYKLYVKTTGKQSVNEVLRPAESVIYGKKGIYPTSKNGEKA